MARAKDVNNRKKPMSKKNTNVCCPECGRELSIRTNRCPVCGTKIKI